VALAIQSARAVAAQDFNMKRIIPFLFAAFTAGATQTNLYQVDLTTTQTNVTSSTALISITNVCTNAVYFSVNSNTIVIGDTLPTAFNKINSNSVWTVSRFTNDESALFYLSNRVDTFIATNPPGMNTNTAVITHSTNSTPQGILRYDQTYLYISIATNTWRRIAIPTNTW
jgi:hypothetical protein